MIIDEDTLELMRNVCTVIKGRISHVSDLNELKKPMMDFCWFVSQAEVGHDMKQFLASFVAALHVVGAINTKTADARLADLRSVGIYGAWEKRAVLESMSGKTVEIDLWSSVQEGMVGDLVIPVEILKEWKTFVELDKLEPVGGAQ